MWSFAHISDPHLAPLPAVRIRDVCNKRVLGLLSWTVRRHAIHVEGVLDALVRDVQAQAPHHVVVTGDLTNIALPEEFVRAAAWLRRVGTPRDVSIIPGNHDAYVAVPWEASFGLWADYMSSEEPCAVVPDSTDDFPCVRLRGGLAFVGVSTALPTAPFLATGKIGPAQLERLTEILRSLGRRGFFRIVAMHHPPTAAATRARKRLVDARPFGEAIASVGAELIVHGHTHRASIGTLTSPSGRTPVIGTPSASACRASGQAHYARYNVYRIEESSPRPRVSLEVRGLDARTLSFVTEEVRELSPATPVVGTSRATNDYATQAR